MEYKKDEAGNDLLDEQGNPIPLEITEEGKEAAKVNANLVEEIKQLRIKNQVIEGLLEEKEKKPEIDPNKVLTDDEKLEALLDKKLKEKAALDAQANKKAAFEKFLTEHKEYHLDNDPTSLKRLALEKKFNQFNINELVTVEEFMSVIKESNILLQGSGNSVEVSREQNPYSNPGKTNNLPPAKRNDELSPKELKLITQSGTTKEKIMKLKATNPTYLEDLLKYVRD